MSNKDHHHHHHDDKKEMTLKEQLTTLLEHWISHNGSHVNSYNDWAEKAEKENLEEVSGIIKKASVLTGEISDLFKEAMDKLS